MMRQSYTNRVLDVANKLAKKVWIMERTMGRADSYSFYNQPSCEELLTKKEKAQLEFVDWKTYDDK